MSSKEKERKRNERASIIHYLSTRWQKQCSILLKKRRLSYSLSTDGNLLDTRGDATKADTDDVDAQTTTAAVRRVNDNGDLIIVELES